MTTQLITPNPNIPCRPGYCLEYVRETFGLPIRYGSATEAWTNSSSQHPDWNFPPGCWVPVWFSIDIEPNGHVALLAPDGSVYSASDLTNTPHHHPSISDVISYYARWGKMQLTYLGWSEDVAGFPVVSDSGSINVESITPTPTPEDDMSANDPFVSKDGVNVTLQDLLNSIDSKVEQALAKATVAASEATNAKVNAADAAGRVSFTYANLGPQVLNTQFKLPDGTVTNLAGILAAIHAQPVTGAVAADPQAIAAAFVDHVNIQITSK